MTTRNVLCAELIVVGLLMAVASGCVFDVSGRPASGADAQIQADVGPSVCGNGQMDPGEACEGSDLGGETCEGLGFVGGTLGCTAECEFDDTQCEIGGDCGNGVLDGEEVCDGSEFGGLTCSSEAGHSHGELLCTGQCTVITSACHTCGKLLLEGPEMCDGPLGGGRDCLTEGHDGGQLACSAACQLDETGCFDCGDGVCDAGAGETRLVCPVDCGWIAVDAGLSHTCAVSGDGTLWCWGLNDVGQLGDGSINDRDQPTLVPALSGVVAVSAGDFHTCAALDDGTAWCWGAGDLGQLGNGSISGSTTPVHVIGLGNVVAVASGGEHTCALSGQTLWCWGKNDKGQLGDNTVVAKDQPVPVSAFTGLSLALSVTAGSKHTCAVRTTDNTAWCWGDKGSGRLGDGTNTDRDEPAAVSELTGLTAVAVISAGEKHTCAVAVNGSPWCWGNKGNGRLGDGANADRFSPEPVSTSTGLVVVVAIAAGLAHSCAVDSAGAAWCWGDNGDGRLGDGTTTERVRPAPVDGTTGFTAALEITAGGLHTCGLKTDHTTWCWGANGDGQLGDGTTDTHASPAPILGD
jgi:alpha-tubulin suppressor-like RCC1 family protein